MVEAVAKPLSDSVQMYLVKIKRLEEQINPVPLSFLADSLCISPVSVNEMCRKMQEQNLIDYQPYKGASLTPEGDREALQVLRRHRLWEVFLVEKLRFSFEQAHEMADELEHATSSDLADRLDDFLGNPPVNPQGKEIPRGEEEQPQLETLPLSALCAGEEGYCLMEGLAQNVQDYLNQAGIHNGGMLQVRGKTDEMMLLAAGGEHVSLALQLCQEIRIIKTEKNTQPQVSRPAGRAGAEAIIKEKVPMEKTETIKLNQVSLDRMKIG
ncbi:MAG: metal-dependent transcriptional regulator, partial [Chloroflexota bacterium]